MFFGIDARLLILVNEGRIVRLQAAFIFLLERLETPRHRASGANLLRGHLVTAG